MLELPAKLQYYISDTIQFKLVNNEKTGRQETKVQASWWFQQARHLKDCDIKATQSG